MVFELTYPHNYKSTLSKCTIRVNDSWYDCSTWRHSHPGGAELIDKFHRLDATDAFYALHSEKAVAMLKRMKSKDTGDDDVERDSVGARFQELRKKLESEGWMKRNWSIDFSTSILPVVVMIVLGTIVSYSHPLIAVFLLGMGMQQAGWIGHDYSHGKGDLSSFLGTTLGGLINGFSLSWWSQKHNTHHIYPNRKEVDSDIHNEPILYLWLGDDLGDSWNRKYQAYYYPLVYMFLFVSWRMQSIQFVMGSKNWVERLLIVLNYVWLACLPWKVAISSILFAGLAVAIVVTANHQVEDIIERDDSYSFVGDQFRTTRGVSCHYAATEYFFGGMQYQLEHHLFPTMPRYRYPALRPIVKKFAEDNGLPFKVNTVPEILMLNFQKMKQVAEMTSGKKNV